MLADPTTRVQTAHPSGLVAQLVEHPLCKRGASGSNPDESMGEIPTWTSKESPPICNPSDRVGCGNAQAALKDTGQVRQLVESFPAADEGGQNPLTLHTQPGLSRKPKSRVHREIEFDFSYVATNQMGDRSVLEPMKVVPSRDITPGRRKEPMNRGLPNGTSWPQGHWRQPKGTCRIEAS